MNLEAKFVHIPREENIDANRLAIAASSGSMTLIRQVLSFIQYSPATNEVDKHMIPTGTNWMGNSKTITLLKVQASHFLLIRDVLYKGGFSLPYLRCLLVSDEANYGVHESGWVELRWFFDPTHYGGLKKSNPTHVDWVGFELMGWIVFFFSPYFY